MVHPHGTEGGALVQTTPATSPTGAPACVEVDASDPSAARRAVGAADAADAEAAEAEARRQRLATAAWPEVAFASA
jgi:hypothetical protein